MKEADKFEEVVTSALEKGTKFELSHDFADRVMSIVLKKALLKEARRDRWWLIAGIVSMIGAMIYVLLTVEFKPGVGVFTFLSGYWGLVVFGVIFVIALHIFDKRVLRHQ